RPSGDLRVSEGPEQRRYEGPGRRRGDVRGLQRRPPADGPGPGLLSVGAGHLLGTCTYSHLLGTYVSTRYVRQ
ncbi:hypothetical protein, partial [Streptomyces umbrinus]|uniref:hypothetical protein n=1 Tax=Streptomyces umbrinus TaxID=67370 RepID=UPI0034000BCA